VGDVVGSGEGTLEGTDVGAPAVKVGDGDGDLEGCSEGPVEVVGGIKKVGCKVGDKLGDKDGETVGSGVGLPI